MGTPLLSLATPHPLKMAPMKAMKASGVMTATGAYQSVAEHGLEDEGCEGRCGCIHGCGRGAGEEVRLLQACGHAEHEAEEQAGDEGAQGHQPLHQGAVCFRR